MPETERQKTNKEKDKQADKCNLFLFSCYHIPTNNVTLFPHINTHTTHNSSVRSDEGLTLETEVCINSVDNIKLSRQVDMTTIGVFTFGPSSMFMYVIIIMNMSRMT